jgi:hypothetical protein
VYLILTLISRFRGPGLADFVYIRSDENIVTIAYSISVERLDITHGNVFSSCPINTELLSNYF